jgi:hypothetical protein
VVDTFKEQRMIVVSGVQGTAKVLNWMHHAWAEAAKDPGAHKQSGPFSVFCSLNEENQMFDRMDNIFPHGEEYALQKAAECGFGR